MVLLSGEVETTYQSEREQEIMEFRMVLLSGEVETAVKHKLLVFTESPVPDGFAIRGS